MCAVGDLQWWVRFFGKRNVLVQMGIEKESIEIDLRLWNALGGIELENNPVKSSKDQYNRNSSSPTRLSVPF